MSSVVCVWTRWGDYALGVRDVRRGQTLRVGSPPRRLVRCGRQAATLWLEGVKRRIEVGESVTVVRDGVHYVVSCTDVGGERFAGPRPWRELLTLAALLGLVALALLSGREHPKRWHEQFVGFAPLPLSRLEGDGAPTPQTELAVASEPQSTALRTQGRMRCGAAEMGRRVAERSGRFAVAGPKDNPDPRLMRPDVDVGFPSNPDGPVLDLFDALGIPHVPVGNDAPTARWGRKDQLGTDERSAPGQMWSEVIGEARGDFGFGVASQPGGVLKRIDVAPTSTGGEHALRVLHTGLKVAGPRKPSEVGRAMSALFEDFRGCAAQATLDEPRRVELAFEVARDGQVSPGAPGPDALDACLVERVSGAKFAPGAPASAEVRYPLYFVPADRELRSAPVTPGAPPEPCDCG